MNRKNKALTIWTAIMAIPIVATAILTYFEKINDVWAGITFIGLIVIVTIGNLKIYKRYSVIKDK